MRGYKNWKQAYRRKLTSANYADKIYEHFIRSELKAMRIKFIMQAPVNGVLEINVHEKNAYALDKVIRKCYNIV